MCLTPPITQQARCISCKDAHQHCDFIGGDKCARCARLGKFCNLSSTTSAQRTGRNRRELQAGGFHSHCAGPSTQLPFTQSVGHPPAYQLVENMENSHLFPVPPSGPVQPIRAIQAMGSFTPCEAPFHPGTGFTSPYSANPPGGSALVHQTPQLHYAGASSSQWLPPVQEPKGTDGDDGNGSRTFTAANDFNFSFVRTDLVGPNPGLDDPSGGSVWGDPPDQTQGFPYSTCSASLEHPYWDRNPASFEYTSVARPLQRSPTVSAQMTNGPVTRGYMNTLRQTPAHWIPGLADTNIRGALLGQPLGDAIPAQLQRHILFALPGNAQLVLEFGGNSPENAEDSMAFSHVFNDSDVS
ncbi:uncharacterized protein EI90DRAFT_3043776 [Cantharellus anzutake]|uniref:uncharacterized protein n=1 Tax=Cantharellus anzutake TaxID=1750568 RepID=UPI0019061126|nr:uncharacterized protein EI90DRAFT_3043776 [Cantharellus anzutake]KAF8336829.1 hypothetical protein EI90DRAFT_3043776 [Cantharellus anzutake]